MTPSPPPPLGTKPGAGCAQEAPGAALTMSYTLSTTNWLAPILVPAAAASSASRSLCAGPRPLPPPRAPRGARAGHYAYSPARRSRGGSIGQPGRSGAPRTEAGMTTGPDRWRARSGSGTSPRRQTRGERRGLSEGRAPRRLGGGAGPPPGLSPPALWFCAAAPRDLKWRQPRSLSNPEARGRRETTIPRTQSGVEPESSLSFTTIPSMLRGPEPQQVSRETTVPSMQCRRSAGGCFAVRP